MKCKTEKVILNKTPCKECGNTGILSVVTYYDKNNVARRKITLCKCAEVEKEKR